MVVGKSCDRVGLWRKVEERMFLSEENNQMTFSRFCRGPSRRHKDLKWKSLLLLIFRKEDLSFSSHKKTARR